MIRHIRALTAIAIAGVLLLSSAPAAIQEHEPLKLRNEFKTPQDVVRYYCNRDASGFVWSGLLEAEKAAFTLWRETPQHDTFYIAKSFEIIPVSQRGSNADHAAVEVRYKISGIGDAHGTVMPTDSPDRRVLFELKRVNGRWKIDRPAPPDVSPVVLESRFPYSRR